MRNVDADGRVVGEHAEALFGADTVADIAGDDDGAHWDTGRIEGDAAAHFECRPSGRQRGCSGSRGPGRWARDRSAAMTRSGLGVDEGEGLDADEVARFVAENRLKAGLR